MKYMLNYYLKVDEYQTNLFSALFSDWLIGSWQSHSSHEVHRVHALSHTLTRSKSCWITLKDDGTAELCNESLFAKC